MIQICQHLCAWHALVATGRGDDKSNDHLVPLSARRRHTDAGPRGVCTTVIEMAFRVAIDRYDLDVPVHASRGPVDRASCVYECGFPLRASDIESDWGH